MSQLHGTESFFGHAICQNKLCGHSQNDHEKSLLSPCTMCDCLGFEIISTYNAMQHFKNSDQWSLQTSELNRRIEELENELTESLTGYIALRKKLRRSKSENEKIKSENEKIKSENEKIKSENEKLQHDIHILTLELNIANSVKRNLKDRLDRKKT